MTETRDFFHRAEEELLRSAVVSSAAFDELGMLSPGALRLIRGAMEFVERNGGGETSSGATGIAVQGYAPSDAECIAAIRLVLMKLKLHTAEPIWSSEVLRRAVEGACSVSGGSLSDLFGAVSSILADYPAELSPARANFIKDLVVECFTQHGPAYNAVDWGAFAQSFSAGATPSQLYLGLLAIPPEHVSESLASLFAAGLKDTPYFPQLQSRQP
jgi:hypothetical protein